VKADDDRIRELYQAEKKAYDAYVKLLAGDNPRRVTPTMVEEARDVWVQKIRELQAAGGSAEKVRQLLQPGSTTTRRRKR
jgi:hypothetical protein